MKAVERIWVGSRKKVVGRGVRVDWLWGSLVVAVRRVDRLEQTCTGG